MLSGRDAPSEVRDAATHAPNVLVWQPHVLPIMLFIGASHPINVPVWVPLGI